MPTTSSFKVTVVGQITGRCRCVIGDVLTGRIAIGVRLRRIQDELHSGWAVRGIESAYSPSTGESVGLILTDAPPLDVLKEMLPPGSVLVSVDGPSE